MDTLRIRGTACGFLAAACCALLAACGSLAAPASPVTPTTVPTTAVPTAPRGPAGAAVRYMPLGDSITEGTPTPGGFRTALWLRMVKKDGDRLDFVGSRSTGPAALGDKDNEGHPGWCIDGPCGGKGDDQIYPRIHGWMVTYHPDVVSIHLGTNDLKLGASGPVVAYRLDETLAQIFRDDPSVRVVLAQIIPMRDVSKPWAEYNRLIPQIAQRYRDQGRAIQVVDLSTVLRQPGDFADSLHPTAEGYQKMADALYPSLDQAYLATR